MAICIPTINRKCCTKYESFDALCRSSSISSQYEYKMNWTRMEKQLYCELFFIKSLHCFTLGILLFCEKFFNYIFSLNEKKHRIIQKFKEILKPNQKNWQNKITESFRQKLNGMRSQSSSRIIIIHRRLCRLGVVSHLLGQR